MTDSLPPAPEPLDEGRGRDKRAAAAPVSESLRHELVASVLVVVALIAVAVFKPIRRALAPSPTEQQCAALVERYLEHAARAMHPDVDEVGIERARAESRGDPMRLADVTSCQQDLTAAQVECGLRSPNVDELERCMQ